jgi:hypothetical protein
MVYRVEVIYKTKMERKSPLDDISAFFKKIFAYILFLKKYLKFLKKFVHIFLQFSKKVNYQYFHDRTWFKKY